MKLPNPVESTSRKTLFNHLRGKRKMKQIGKGAFARVYSRPKSRRVVKVGDGCDKYLKYVSMVGKENPNPYFPTIYSIKRCAHQLPHWLDSFYIVEMEKLTKWGNVPKATRDRLLKKLGCNHIWDADVPKVNGSSGRWEKEAIKTLRKLWATYDVARDIHQGNIMFRRVGKGWQLVYTDPVA
jgi:hypothetical protein